MKIVIDMMVEKGICDDYIVLVGGVFLNEEFGCVIGFDVYCCDVVVVVEMVKEYVVCKYN